jgi:aspartate aminotransferase
MLEILNAVPGITCDRPQGAFYLFPRVAGLISRRTPQGKVLENEQDIVLHLLEHAGVAVVQGAAYGVSPHMRISIAYALDSVIEGGRRIAKAVAELR